MVLTADDGGRGKRGGAWLLLATVAAQEQAGVVVELRAKASMQRCDDRGVGQDKTRGGLLAKQSEAERG
jgi:hypothetical protein